MEQEQFDIQDPRGQEVVEVEKEKVVDPHVSTKEKVVPFVRLLTPIVGFIIVILNHYFEVDFPFTTVEVTELIGAVLMLVGTIWAWWKNNDVTPTAQRRKQAADEVLNKIDRDGL